MPAFKERFGVSHQSESAYANTNGWIVSIATAGAAFGCLSCSWLNSRLGRIKTLLIYTVIYVGGVLGQTFSNGSLAALYVARIIAGFGIGGTTVVPSIYLSEIAPEAYPRPHHRTICRTSAVGRCFWILLQLWCDQVSFRYGATVATPHGPSKSSLRSFGASAFCSLQNPLVGYYLSIAEPRLSPT